MRPQVGKRSNNYNPPTVVNKTLSRKFVENKTRQNLSIGGDFLFLDDVVTAINVNALEQRMITKKKILSDINKGISVDKIKKILEVEIDLHRHHLVKMGFGNE